MVAAAVAGATLATGVYSANKQSKAAKNAASSQDAAAQAGIDLQREQMQLQQAQIAKIESLLRPYVDAGSRGLLGQRDLLGLNGENYQRAALNQIEKSPYFGDLVKSGETAILQNASATGGLRGGNTQGALAQFRPQMLNALIDQQYQRYGQLAALGQNSVLGAANAGQSAAAGAQGIANNQSALLGQIGAAQAGSALAAGRADAGYANAVTGALGAYYGLGGFGSGTGGGITGTGGASGMAAYGGNTGTLALNNRF